MKAGAAANSADRVSAMNAAANAESLTVADYSRGELGDHADLALVDICAELLGLPLSDEQRGGVLMRLRLGYWYGWISGLGLWQSPVERDDFRLALALTRGRGHMVSDQLVARAAGVGASDAAGALQGATGWPPDPEPRGGGAPSAP